MTGRPLATLLAWAFAANAAAQTAPGGYARVAGDTARYHRVLTVSSITDLPRGEASIFVSRDESVGLTFVGHDSAVAWLDALDVSESSPAGRKHPSTDSVLHRPFRLRLDARGRTRLLAAPTIPDSVQSLVDFDADFASLLPEVPATPLAVGAEWTDTSTHVSQQRNGNRISTRTIAHLKAVRDTTVGATAALVLTGSIDDSTSAASPPRDGRPGSLVTITGTGTALYVFATNPGHFLGGAGSIDERGTFDEHTGAGTHRYPETVHSQWTMQPLSAP